MKRAPAGQHGADARSRSGHQSSDCESTTHDSVSGFHGETTP
jgi:hypothetical protein